MRRLAHPNLRRRKFFQDRVIRTPAGNRLVKKVVKDIAWYGPDGDEVSDEAWSNEWIRAIALFLNGQTLITNENGEPVIDQSFLILVNASHEGVEFTLPDSPTGNPWVQIMEPENIDDPFARNAADEKVIVDGRSLKLFNDALLV